MAKRRPVTTPAAPSFRWHFLAVLAAAGWGALLVMAIHWPADSVEVERGAAIYHCGLALASAALVWLAMPDVSRFRRWLSIDLAAWALAAWMGWSAWALSDQINLRMAVNECWMWAAGAACFTAARRLFRSPLPRRTVVVLIVLSAALLAAHGWHQLAISLPADRARYQLEPEVVLAEADIDAPEGSARRMIFENRLRDGGPTATFALTNSLAGLMVPAWLLAAGILVSQWRELATVPRCGWASTVLLIGSLLLATNSRSAVGAVVLVSFGGLLWAILRDGGAVRRRMDRRAWAALGGGVVVVSLGLFGYAVSNRELTERAGASLGVRLQYWKSTLAMVADSPWFGCGPGNFQAAYQAYRDIDASEQIADPHNFVMETAAAGGVPAVLLLMLLAGLMVRRLQKGFGTRSAEEPLETTDSRAEGASATVASSLGMGYGVGWVVVWMLGLLIAQAPDIGAHLWAVPIACLLAACVWRWVPMGELPRPVVLGAVGGLLLHLTMSGGWTIPGVAVPLWLLAGAMLAEDPGVHSSPTPSPAGNRLVRARWVIGSLAGGILVAFFWTALRPVSEASRWMMEASAGRQGGRIEQVEQAYRKAAAADPWDASPSAALADLYRHVLLGQDRPDLRQALEAAGQAARQASPGDPALLVFLGDQRLHLYQRWGREEDLQAALQWYQEAAVRSPANERLAAQLAVIYQALDDDRWADWAQRAQTLASAGGHAERSLQRVTILQAAVVGQSVSKGPQQGTAEELLPNRNVRESVPNH